MIQPQKSHDVPSAELHWSRQTQARLHSKGGDTTSTLSGRSVPEFVVTLKQLLLLYNFLPLWSFLMPCNNPCLIRNHEALTDTQGRADLQIQSLSPVPTIVLGVCAIVTSFFLVPPIMGGELPVRYTQGTQTQQTIGLLT